jgi:hypothetical protein
VALVGAEADISVGEKWRFDDYLYLCKGLY